MSSLKATGLMCSLTIGLLVGTLATACAQRTTLWYRGYFDGEVTIKSGPNPGYYYRPSRPTAYPLHEHQYSDRLPCDVCGYYHRPGAYVPQLRRRCGGQGTHLDPDQVYVRAPNMLPGQYWHERQSHYGFRTPITVGWPYMKYEQRRDYVGDLPLGRASRTRMGRFHTR